MKSPNLELLEENIKKTDRAVNLLSDSIKRTKPFDPKTNYTSLELEPYDALTSRFERAIEMIISKCFRSFDIYSEGISEGSLRDLLNRLEKKDIITESVDKWLSMRELRNKIAHDYLPQKLKEMYDSIIKFFPEMKKSIDKLKKEID